MNKPEYFVGIDIASTTFTSAIGVIGEKWQIVVKPETFENEYDHLEKYKTWLQAHGLMPSNCVICMEATGVYGEVLAHYLVVQHYPVAVEPPLKVRRAFKPAGSKSDPVDTRQIAEYAYRFWDELVMWAPREEILERVKTLLAAREQYVAERTGHHNALHALKRKVVRTDLVEQMHEKTIQELTGHIKELEAEISRLIHDDPDLKAMYDSLTSVPGVKLLLAAHMIVVLQSAPQPCTPKTLAAFVGICPYEHSSGTSIHFTPTSRHFGPPALRKLLFLASLSIAQHNQHFKTYYARKVLDGKPKKLVLNNIANKLLKVMVVVVRSKTKINTEYRSVNPGLLKPALT